MNKLGLATALWMGLLLAAPGAAAQELSELEKQTSSSMDLLDLEDLSLLDLLDTSFSTASKTREKSSEAPGVVSVVTRDDLERFGGISLKNILARVPSLTPCSTPFADRSTLAVRGDQIRIDSGHVLFLINGRPTREALQGGVGSDLLEAFPVDVIDRIEVIRGPGSVLYGSNAFSAVVNIITREPKKGSQANLTSLGGLPASYVGSGTVLSQLGDLKAVVSARQAMRADWTSTYRYSPPSSVDVTTSEVRIPNLRQGAYLGLDYRNLKLSSSFTQWKNAYFREGDVGAGRWNRAFADLGYEIDQIAGVGWSVDAHATYTRAEARLTGERGLARRSQELVGEVTNFIQPAEDLNLVVGATGSLVVGGENYLEPNRVLTVSEGQRSSASVYAQVDYRVLPPLKLVVGTQLNAIERIDPNLVPRAGVIWNVFEPLTVKILYGQAFRAPSINELELRHPELWGQPDLKPEHVGTLDAGINYYGDGISAGLNYFRTSQERIIQIDSTPTSRVAAPSYYNNTGDVTIQGAELEGKYYVTRSLYLTGSALYFQSENAAGETAVTPVPGLGAKAGVSYSWRGLGASAFYVYQSELEPRYDSRLNPDPVEHHLVDLHAKMDIGRVFELRSLRGLTLLAQAENVLDQQLYLPDWGGVAGETVPVNPGRTVYLGLSLPVGTSGAE